MQKHCPSWWFSRWRCCFERPALSSIELYSITIKKFHSLYNPGVMHNCNEHLKTYENIASFVKKKRRATYLQLISPSHHLHGWCLCNVSQFQNVQKMEDGLLLATHSRDRLIKVIKFDTNKMNVSIMILFS